MNKTNMEQVQQELRFVNSKVISYLTQLLEGKSITSGYFEFGSVVNVLRDMECWVLTKWIILGCFVKLGKKRLFYEKVVGL